MLGDSSSLFLEFIKQFLILEHLKISQITSFLAKNLITVGALVILLFLATFLLLVYKFLPHFLLLKLLLISFFYLHPLV
jgi:hypothetical protein